MGLFDTNKEEEEVLLMDEDMGTGDNSFLIVYNDDHNTFDWVIQAFVEVCRHNPQQAEQLSLIVHFKGKATVKTAPLNQLKPLRRELANRGLSAVIESVKEKM